MIHHGQSISDDRIDGIAPRRVMQAGNPLFDGDPDTDPPVADATGPDSTRWKVSALGPTTKSWTGSCRAIRPNPGA